MQAQAKSRFQRARPRARRSYMQNTMTAPACLVACEALLGEGPLWDARDDSLWWVDIKAPAIFRRAADGALSRFVPPMRVGALVPATAGGFVAATEHGFFAADPQAGLYRPLHDPEPELPGNRFNDGKLDREGRFWAGTMDDAEAAATGSLYRLEAGSEPVRVDSGYRVTNGPAFSPAGDLLYHTDSARQIVYAFDLAPDCAVSGKRELLRFGEGDGYPDGMTVDAEGCLWIAFWDGWCIRRFAPDGARLDEIALPVARPTSCAFGGRGLDTLFVTSARIGLDAAALAAQPLAGGLFHLRPGVAGLAERPFGGA